eukprot:403336445
MKSQMTLNSQDSNANLQSQNPMFRMQTKTLSIEQTPVFEINPQTLRNRITTNNSIQFLTTIQKEKSKETKEYQDLNFSDNQRIQALSINTSDHQQSQNNLMPLKNILMSQMKRMSDILEEDSNYDQTSKHQDFRVIEGMSKRKKQKGSFKDYKDSFKDHTSGHDIKEQDEISLNEGDESVFVNLKDIEQMKEIKFRTEDRENEVKTNLNPQLLVQKVKSSNQIDQQFLEPIKNEDQTSRIFSKQLTGLSEFSTVKSMPRKSIQSNGFFDQSISKISSIFMKNDNQSDQSQNSFFIHGQDPKHLSPLRKLKQKHASEKIQDLEILRIQDQSQATTDKRFTLDQKSLFHNQNRISLNNHLTVGNLSLSQNNSTGQPGGSMGNQIGKLLQLSKNINSIPEEDEETQRRKSTISKNSLKFPGQQQHLMKSNEFSGKSNVMGKNTGNVTKESEIKSVYMKSSIAFKIMSSVQDKIQDLVRIDPYEKLDKSSDSYKQLKKNPISYKVIQARLDKFRNSKDKPTLKQSADVASEPNHSQNRSRENNRTPTDLTSQIKSMQPVSKNFLKVNFAKGLIKRIEEQRTVKQSEGLKVLGDRQEKSRNTVGLFDSLNNSLSQMMMSIPNTSKKNQRFTMTNEALHSQSQNNSFNKSQPATRPSSQFKLGDSNQKLNLPEIQLKRRASNVGAIQLQNLSRNNSKNSIKS